MYLLVYHPEPKFSSNVVQIILANTHMNIQLNTAATNVRGGGKFYTSFLCDLSWKKGY